MPKTPSSAVGLDLGRYALKSVVLNRRGKNRVALSGYAVHVVGDGGLTAESLAEHLRSLLKISGGAKACGVAVSSSDALMRIIEQPDTPRELLRDALRLNGMSILNQDCRDFVLDCDAIAPAEERTSKNEKRYLVGGLPRKQIDEITTAFQKTSATPNVLQLAPVCAFNAFEFAEPETFNNHSFLLADIGHLASTVMVGSRRELVLVRTIDFGGKALLDTLLLHSGGKNPAEALQALEKQDELMTASARLALATLTRELSSSIGFFEGQREETISRIFVSGGPARSKAVMSILSEELHTPCEVWNPFAKCEIALPAKRRDAFEGDLVNLNVACGAAAELLKES